VVVVVVVIVVVVATTTTATTATTTTPLDHDWRSLMVRRLSKQNWQQVQQACTDSVWQRGAPGKFGTASSTVLAAYARGQQASELHVEPNSVDPSSFFQQETSNIKLV
jgi:hypothetical protein